MERVRGCEGVARVRTKKNRPSFTRNYFFWFSRRVGKGLGVSGVLVRGRAGCCSTGSRMQWSGRFFWSAVSFLAFNQVSLWGGVGCGEKAEVS